MDRARWNIIFCLLWFTLTIGAQSLRADESDPTTDSGVPTSTPPASEPAEPSNGQTPGSHQSKGESVNGSSKVSQNGDGGNGGTHSNANGRNLPVQLPVVLTSNPSGNRSRVPQNVGEPSIPVNGKATAPHFRLDAYPLPNLDSVNRYADNIIARIKELQIKDPLIRIYHIEGRELPQGLQDLVTRFSQADIKVEGVLIKKEEIQSLFNGIETGLPDEKEMESHLLTFEKESGPIEKTWRRKILDYLTLKPIRDRLKRFFGTPKGITWVEHVYETNPDGSTARDEQGRKIPKFAKNRGLNRLALYMTIGANVTFSSAILVQGVASFQDASFYLANAVVAAWTYVSTRWSRQQASFDEQGRSIWVDDKAKTPDKKFRVSRSVVFHWTARFVREMILNGVLIRVLFPGSEFGTRLLTQGAPNAFLTAYVGLVEARYRSRLFREAQAAKERGDIRTHDRIMRRAWWISMIWGNILLPLARVADLITGPDAPITVQLATKLPLLCMGTACIVAEAVWQKKTGERDSVLHRFKRLFSGLFFPKLAQEEAVTHPESEKEAKAPPQLKLVKGAAENPESRPEARLPDMFEGQLNREGKPMSPEDKQLRCGTLLKVIAKG